MVVDENESGGAVLDRAPKDRSGIKLELPDGPMVQLLVRDQAVGSVQEKDAQHLVRQRSHRGHEILAELGAGRVDRLRCQVGLQTLKEHVPGAEQDIRDRRVVTQNPLERFWRLGQDPSDAAEFLQQRGG
nr:hypothetical protein [Sphingobium sp. HDIP04]